MRRHRSWAALALLSVAAAMTALVTCAPGHVSSAAPTQTTPPTAGHLGAATVLADDLLGPVPTPTPSPTPGPTPSPDDGPCSVSPVLGAFCSIGQGIDNAPGQATHQVVSSVGDGIIGAMTRWVANGAAWVLKQVTALIENSTTPDLTAQWFQRNYATMASLAGVLLAVFLFFATVQGLVANRPSMILRAYLLHAPIAALGTVLAIALVSRGLQATDAMSAAVSAHMHHDVARIADRVGEATVLASRVTGDGSLFIAFLGALVAVVVAVILWLELLIRQAAIDVCVLFLPLVLAAFVWPSTARWLRRLINTLAAIVLSKFVIVAVLALSAAALADDVHDGGIKAILVGVVLLILAAICPYLVFRLLPGVELAITGRWLQGGMRTASRRAPTPGGGGGGPWRGGGPVRTGGSAVTVAAWTGPAAAAATTAARAGRVATTSLTTAAGRSGTRPGAAGALRSTGPRTPTSDRHRPKESTDGENRDG